MKYRSDIDGLRGIAVLAVVLFHAGAARVSGGFVGVDVFFVISGYLITTLVLGDIQEGRFSIAHFYERRARRILPALFVVLLASSIGAYWLLFPRDLRDYSESMVATLFFYSNFVFWKESGYFDAPAETKPLLHTWSLAVEEQFYLFYPLLLFLAWRFFRRRFATVVILVLGLSLGTSIVAIRYAPKFAFYLAPARIWELLCGSLLALQIFPVLSSPIVASLTGALGLGLIASSILTFSSATTFPGYNALFPVLGAGLVIYSGSSGRSLIGRILSTRPIVFVGLISYSLYLWHWVLLVFMRYGSVRSLTLFETTAVVGAAFVLSYLSWRYVENPVRRRQILGPTVWLFLGTAIATCIFSAWGVVAIAKGGLPRRLTREARVFIRGQTDFWARRDECFTKFCNVGADGKPPSFLLWGDSHASAIAPAVDIVARSKHISGITALHKACAPLIGLTRFDLPELHCREENSSVVELIRSEHIKNVILHARWAVYSEGQRYKDEIPPAEALTPNIALTETLRWQDNYSVFERLLQTTLRQLRELQTNIIIIASVPEVGRNVPLTLARASVSGIPSGLEVLPADFLQRQSRTFELLRRMADEYSASIVYPHEILCDSKCILVTESHPVYTDEHHLSLHGAMLLRPFFDHLLDTDLK